MGRALCSINEMYLIEIEGLLEADCVGCKLASYFCDSRNSVLPDFLAFVQTLYLQTCEHGLHNCPNFFVRSSKVWIIARRAYCLYICIYFELEYRIRNTALNFTPG